MSVQTQMKEQEHPGPVNMVELHGCWAQVKAAIDELLDVYHSSGEGEDDRLDEICEYFELKVDFDSPLAEDE